LTTGRRPVVKIIAESLSQHDEEHTTVVLTLLSGIRVGKRKNSNIIFIIQKNIDFVMSDTQLSRYAHMQSSWYSRRGWIVEIGECLYILQIIQNGHSLLKDIRTKIGGDKPISPERV
jgi:hypothetical protein